MLLTARKIILIHVLMRLPDFVKPVVAAADRFLKSIQEEKLFLAASLAAVARRSVTPRRSRLHRRHWLTPQRLPRPESHDG